MLCLSQTTGYAIRALSHMGVREPDRVRANEIARQTGMPSQYLSKLLHALGRYGLIKTKRGYRGGFLLSRPANRITLLSIVQAVEGNPAPRCLLGWAECSDRRACPAHRFWKTTRARLERELERLTLADVELFTDDVKRKPARRKPRRGRPPGHRMILSAR